MAGTPSERDLQELLRLLTTTRKLPILQAMGQVKALQAENLRSIQQIAEAPLATVEGAIKDAAGAKSLQTSCKAALKKKGGSAGSKRTAGGDDAELSAAKRTKSAASSGSLFRSEGPTTPAELEKSLELPVFCPEDEEGEARIASTVLQTNRAPLVLAFAVELLRYTMPEQPLSSRLSLAQAVVSANSRSKASSLGMTWARGPSAEDEGWGDGQPRVRILGREIAVLKRGGYTWRGEEEEEEGETGETDHKAEPGATASEPPSESEEAAAAPAVDAGTDAAPVTARHAAIRQPPPAGVWTVSQTILLKDSTFVARATTMASQAQRATLLKSLMDRNPRLRTASHNAWAYRVRGGGDYANVRQDAYDDGETGCGDLMLNVMRELNTVDTLVVLSRWFGGTLLGPDRWRLMRNAVTGALAERLRLTGAEVTLGGEAVWGLDLEGMRNEQSGQANAASSSFSYGPSSSLTTVVGMPTHRPEGARHYLLKSFATFEGAHDHEAATSTASSPAKSKKKKKTIKAMEAEKADNLGLLLGALRLLYDSWADHLTAAELDRRAWSWYVAVRPDVDVGPSGWGAKGALKLKAILALRRVEEPTLAA